MKMILLPQNKNWEISKHLETFEHTMSVSAKERKYIDNYFVISIVPVR